MNLLCVSYAFPPISSPGSMRVYHFAKYLAQQENYKVDVLYCNNGYSSMVDKTQTWDIGNIGAIAVDDLINKNSFIENKVSTDKIKKTTLKNLLKAMVFPDRDITWFLNLLKENIKNKKYDYIFCSYPNITNLIVGYYFSKKFNVDLIVDMRDLWVQDLSFINKNILRRFLEKNIENKILKHAKKIITVSQFNAEQLSNIYGKKVSIVYNGFDDEKFKTLLAEKKQEPIGGRFRLVYAGSFYEGERKVDCLFQALYKLKLDGLINKNNFVFEIYGNKENYIANLIQQSQQAKATVVVLGMKIPPNYGTAYSQAFEKNYSIVSQQYKVKLMPFFLTGVAGNKNLMQSDLVHPNAKAQSILLNNAYPYIKGAL